MATPAVTQPWTWIRFPGGGLVATPTPAVDESETETTDPADNELASKSLGAKTKRLGRQSSG
jgi:hypothetical protein